MTNLSKKQILALQDAYHYAALMAGDRYSAFEGTGCTKAYAHSKAAEKARVAGFEGTTYASASRANGKRLADALQAFGKANGVDAETACLFCACGAKCDDESDTLCCDCKSAKASKANLATTTEVSPCVVASTQENNVCHRVKAKIPAGFGIRFEKEGHCSKRPGRHLCDADFRCSKEECDGDGYENAETHSNTLNPYHWEF